MLPYEFKPDFLPVIYGMNKNNDKSIFVEVVNAGHSLNSGPSKDQKNHAKGKRYRYVVQM